MLDYLSATNSVAMGSRNRSMKNVQYSQYNSLSDVAREKIMKSIRSEQNIAVHAI